MVVGDRSALIRRACSRDWRPGWPFSGAVGNHHTAIPVNRPSGAGCFLTLQGQQEGKRVFLSLNAPSGAGCFLTGNSKIQIAGIES